VTESAVGLPPVWGAALCPTHEIGLFVLNASVQ
jgi:hypothetical protein